MTTEQTITAQVVLKRADGRSILDAEAALTSGNIGDFAVPVDRIQAAAAQLQQLGFKIETHDTQTMSITGPPKLYADIFGLAYQTGVAVHATRIPEDLSTWIADVAVTPAPLFFRP